MKTSQQINIEKLSKEHRDELSAFAWANWRNLRAIEAIAESYEGKIHTRLDTVRCILQEANEAFNTLLGHKDEGGRIL